MKERLSPLGLGIAGAVVASMCCATPVLFVTLGIATSSLVVAWLNLKPIFLAVAATVLVAGVAVTLMRSRRTCSTTSFRRRLLVVPLVTALSFGIGFWLLMDVATPQLYAQVYNADQSSVARTGVVVEPDGDVVALRRASFKIYMGCEGCASTLRTVFLGLPGVHAAAVNPHERRATVLYDPTRISARTIQSKIPYPWYYAPHLTGDVATAMTSASSTFTLATGSLLALLAAIAVLLSATSAAVWRTTRRPAA